MAQIHCEVITAERVVFEGDVDMVVAPGVMGQLGILPHHAPLMTALTYGELTLHRAGQEDEFIAIGGGFVEVGPEHVIILADSAERAEEIDEARAASARQRAEELMAQKQRDDTDLARAEAALRRSAVRLKVARRRGHRGSPGRPPTLGQPPGSGGQG
jgi:F-type H+-transporting ATPase subunit epsilon